MSAPTHAVIVKAYIWRDGKCLLLKRHADDEEYPGFWDNPGGHLKSDEGALQGLFREIAEETGLVTTRARPLSTWDHFKGTESRIGISFLATDPGGKVTLSPEHEDFVWAAPDAIAHMPMAENLKRELLWIVARDWHL
ncbi:MAG: NUDIX domain-containing protein [Parvibaculum sp.]